MKFSYSLKNFCLGLLGFIIYNEAIIQVRDYHDLLCGSVLSGKVRLQKMHLSGSGLRRLSHDYKTVA